jgi:hypothetical protein
MLGTPEHTQLQPHARQAWGCDSEAQSGCRCGSQAIVVLGRDQAFGSVRAPILLASATVLTEFPPFEVQKRAMTQAQASALAKPRITGAPPRRHACPGHPSSSQHPI